MFASKGHHLGGTNDIFEKKILVHEDLPPAVLRYADAEGNVVASVISKPLLDSFSHYMGAGLVIIKPLFRTLTTAQELFLKKLREWLTVKEDGRTYYDYKERKHKPKLYCYYIENDAYMMIPKTLALTCFADPSIWLPHCSVGDAAVPFDETSNSFIDIPIVEDVFCMDVASLRTPSALEMIQRPEHQMTNFQQVRLISRPRLSNWSALKSPPLPPQGDASSSSPYATVTQGNPRVARIDKHPFFIRLFRHFKSAMGSKLKYGCGLDGVDSGGYEKKPLVAAAKKKGSKRSHDGTVKSKRQKIDHANPAKPLNDDLPLPVLCIPLLKLESAFPNNIQNHPLLNCYASNEDTGALENISMFQYPTPEYLLTRPLVVKGSLRKLPTDQLPIVAALIHHYRNGFLHFGNDDASSLFLCLTWLLVCLGCGDGKTRAALHAWAWMRRSCFDKYTVQDMESPLFAMNDHLRQSDKPERTYRLFWMVHTKSLMNQVAKVVRECIPDAVIGILKQDQVPNPLECDIVIASTDTLAAQDDFDPSYLHYFPLVIGDEAHQNKASFFMRAVRKIPSPFGLWLTATPRFWLLALILGAVLIYKPTRYDEQYTNMIVYAVGQQKERTMKIGGEYRPNGNGQLVDLVVDMRRNEWLAYLHMVSFLVGKSSTSTHSLPISEAMKRRAMDPLNEGRRAQLYQVLGNLGSAIAGPKAGFDALHTPSVSNDGSEAASSSSTAKQTTARRPAMKMSSGYADRLLQTLKDTKSAATTTDVAKRTSANVFAEMSRAAAQLNAKSSTAPAKLPSSAPTSSHAMKPALRRLANFAPTPEVYAPYDERRNSRNPIFPSKSVPHLIMHQFWQAQYWIDTCSSIEKKHLMLVRTNLREISVIDVRRLPEEMKAHLKWLSPRGGYQLSASDCISSHGEGNPVSLDQCLTKSVSCDGNDCIAEFNAFFFKKWFETFPLNEDQASEDDILLATKPAQKRSFFGATKKSAAAPSPLEALPMMVGANLKNASAMDAILGAISSASSPPPTNVDAGIVAKAKRQPKKTAAENAALVQEKHHAWIREMAEDCISQRFKYTDWMHHASFWWTPILTPLPKPAKRDRALGVGIWQESRFASDLRPQLPTLATFGLYVGDNYAIPKALADAGKCKPIHLEDALAAKFVYATYQIAAVGIDKANLESCTEGTVEKDNEQNDGRCSRILPGKQIFVKNELVEPWSFYKSFAYKHQDAYKSQHRTVNMYRIDYLDNVEED